MPAVGAGGHAPPSPFTCPPPLVSLATGAPVLDWRLAAAGNRECDRETRPLCSQVQVPRLGKIS